MNIPILKVVYSGSKMINFHLAIDKAEPTVGFL